MSDPGSKQLTDLTRHSPRTRQPSEAIDSAIEEFKSQGVDLTGIFTGTGLQAHAVFKLSSQLSDQIEKKDVEAIALSLESLRVEIEKENADVVTAVLLAAKTMHAFEPGVRVLRESSQQQSSQTLASFLYVYAKLLRLSSTLREAFRETSQVNNVGAIRVPLVHDNLLVQSAGLTLAGSLATQDEAGKAVVMAMDPHEHIVSVLDASRGDDLFQRGVEAATALIVPLASADDTTQPSSSAFANARKLSQSGVSEALVASLRVIWSDSHEDTNPSMTMTATTCQLCTGIKLLAANDEICKELVQELDLLNLLFVVLKSNMVHADAGRQGQTVAVMASVMALLRQMMASDHVKHAVDTSEFISIASHNLQMYIDEAYAPAADPGNKVLEHTLGTVSALCLRNPEASEAVVDSGCAQLILTAMQIAVDRKDGYNSAGNDDRRATGSTGANVGKSLRQGCMAVRNIASRSPHVRDVLRSYNAVQVIENCKVAAKTACADVGDAAIRDVTNTS